FQAEDGIRDDLVTGVQTCALPILRERWPDPVQLVLEPGRSLVGRAGVTLYRVGVVKQSGGVSFVAIDGGMSDNPRPQLYDARYRSEERRVGKECRSGWTPAQYEAR